MHIYLPCILQSQPGHFAYVFDHYDPLCKTAAQTIVETEQKDILACILAKQVYTHSQQQ